MAIASVTKADRRSIGALFVPPAAAIAAGVLLGLALPKSSVWPFAVAGLTAYFWSWYKLEVRSAFMVGFLAGVVYFSIAFSWFGETAGALVGPLGFVIVLVPALIEALAFGLAALFGAIALRSAPRALAPLACAAAFTLAEAIRSSGPLGVPFGVISYSQVDSPFAPLAAFVGSEGLTFALCAIAAYLAYGLRETQSIPTARTAGIALASVAAATALAWIAWPARTFAEPTTTVVAVQGNIKQSMKWTRSAFDLALRRYESLSMSAARQSPSLIVWPETVITTDLNLAPWLQARFSQLAKAGGAELVVGSKEARGGVEYNALYLFNRNGVLEQVYRKRRLVPFAETLPAPAIFGRLPYMDLVSRFGVGTDTGVFDAGGLRFAPMICWESAFSELAIDGVRDGGQAILIATDDAWFGETGGPFQHAQIAQMRALETGSWVVRAAATGISGIIAPNGRWRERAGLDREAVISGGVGPPARTLYAFIGPLPVELAIAALYVGLLFVRRRRT